MKPFKIYLFIYLQANVWDLGSEQAENILTLPLTACCRIHILIEQLHHTTVLTLVCLCLCLSPEGSQRISDSEFSDYDGEDGVGVVSGKMLAGTVKMTPSDGGDEDIYC